VSWSWGLNAKLAVAVSEMKDRNKFVLSRRWMFSLLLAVTIGASNPSAAEKVVHIWHTEPNHMTLTAMREIISDYEQLNPDIRIEQEAGDIGSCGDG